MKTSLRQIISSNAKGLVQYDLYIKLTVYPPAMLLAWVFLNMTTISASQLTVAGFTLGIIGALASLHWGLMPLVIGYLLAYTIDYADGTLARNGRSEGERGVFLDLLCDRTLISFTAIMLSIHHVRQQEALALGALLVYFVVYTYEDIVSYALRVARNRYQRPFYEDDYGIPPLTWRTACLQWQFFLPTRLSSPLVVIGIGLLCREMAPAYLAGTGAVLVGYATQGFKSWLKQRTPQTHAPSNAPPTDDGRSS